MITDFHTHILPGMDDGSADLEQSVQMLQLMQQQGVPRVVATPHFYAAQEDPRRFLKRREEACAKLNGALTEELPRVFPGAEVRYFEGISDCDALEELTLAGSKYLLVEMPSPPWTQRMYQQLMDIYHKQGLVPVIAHVDRYISPWRTHGIPEKLAQLPVLIQANTSFFLRPLTRKTALRMLQQGQIHLLGSDCHNLTRRSPNLGKAAELIRKHLGQEALEELIRCEDRILL